MKKVLFVGMVFGALALTSCKKEYQCAYPGGAVTTYSEKDYSDSEISTAKTACIFLDGTWSEK
ncbi:MAG TPA: hypothetical protein VFD77_00050 [Brumimicrobium sp.]|nr:hypothetical protein [Brumimicrobium sp.]